MRRRRPETRDCCDSGPRRAGGDSRGWRHEYFMLEGRPGEAMSEPRDRRFGEMPFRKTAVQGPDVPIILRNERSVGRLIVPGDAPTLQEFTRVRSKMRHIARHNSAFDPKRNLQVFTHPAPATVTTEQIGAFHPVSAPRLFLHAGHQRRRPCPPAIVARPQSGRPHPDLHRSRASGPARSPPAKRACRAQGAESRH